MASQWIEHVKSYAKKHNMKYGDCMGNAECKAEYHSSKGAGLEGGKFHFGKSLKKLNTKIKDVAVSKAAGQYLNTVKKSGQVVKTGLNFVKKSGLAEYVPGGEEMVDAGIDGIKYQNRGINILQDKRQKLIDRREERQQRREQLNGGSMGPSSSRSMGPYTTYAPRHAYTADKRYTTRGGSFKNSGGSFNFHGGSMPMNDKYEAVYGNTNGIDRNSQSFYPDPNDSKSLRKQMFGVR